MGIIVILGEREAEITFQVFWAQGYGTDHSKRKLVTEHKDAEES